ncbi:hypothetical protein B1757_13210 [Acidithiobacillus marinus]|uniref:Uncharacterized protein n=1 Tax=Acidithiobacillus marinus TaxID=187490 RepID=A0A2I1DIP6_9PROT|nr:hypothetical protein [Acidithiobacillus marinus]PKY09753.1 hypothetical protein B1757_13210 [Acidithiobacillus marinus]
MNKKLLDMLGNKGLGHQNKDRKEPTVNDPLIDEALDEQGAQESHPDISSGHNEEASQSADDEGDMAITTSVPPSDELADAGSYDEAPSTSADLDDDTDDFDVQVSPPSKYASHNPNAKKKKIIAFSVASAIILGIAAFGYEQMKNEHAAEAQINKVRAEQPHVLSGKITNQELPASKVASTNPATEAAASLSPQSVQQQMQPHAHTASTTVPIIHIPKQKTSHPVAQASETPPPSSPRGGESAYLRWADSQIHQGGAPKEPVIPSSALSDTPPSGPGLTGSASPYSAPNPGYSAPSAPYTPMPEYHRPAFGLAIPGTQQPQKTANIGEPALPTTQGIRATVTQKTPPPYEVIRTLKRGGESYAYVIKNGAISTGHWVSFGHRFASGWIVGKVSNTRHTVTFSAPQGYAVTVGAR